MGFVLTPSGKIATELIDLRDRAFKARMKIKHSLVASFNENVPLISGLIQSLVKPILLYASDFWECLKVPKINPIDVS